MELEAGPRRAGTTDEDDLVLEVAAGDAAALRLLYRAFERPLYSLGVRWLHDRHLAEELVQEVTLRMWRHARRFDPAQGTAGAWIFGIAHNVARDLARARGRAPVPVAEPRSGTSPPWDEAAAWEGWQVARALQHLPVEQQQVIELAYVGQLTQAEIAGSLGIPLGTVKTRLYAGLRKLRERLLELGVVEETR